MISNIANSKYSARICTEKCQEFGKWYKEYHREHKPSLSGVIPLYSSCQSISRWYFLLCFGIKAYTELKAKEDFLELGLTLNNDLGRIF